MALYHKHRPQTFGTIIGQEHIITTILNQVALGKIAHAYLFSGPRGVGKTTTARILAKAVNCPNRDKKTHEPCDTCDSCVDISHARAIDVIEIDAASHTGVDNVRENIIDNAQFRPTKSPHKVFIIDEVHMLSSSAFNALLKTLEEPPAHVIFILATTELHKLPETIISRCQRFDFKKIPQTLMVEHLAAVAKTEGVKIDTEVIERIAEKSDGYVRDAMSLLDQILAIGEKHITLEHTALFFPASHNEDVEQLVNSLADDQAKTALELIHALTERGVHMFQFSGDLVNYLRRLLIAAIQKKPYETTSKLSAKDLVALIDLFLRRRGEIKTSPIPELPLELGVVEWCSRHSDNTARSSSVIDQTPAPAAPPVVPPAPPAQPPGTKTVTPPPAPASAPTTPPPAETTTLETPRDELADGSDITKTDAERAWKGCMQQLEQSSPSLVFILKMATITGITDGIIHISVPYRFHADKLKENECQKRLHSMLCDFLKKKVTFDVTITEADQVQQEDPIPAELQNLASAFGGQVIN